MEKRATAPGNTTEKHEPHSGARQQIRGNGPTRSARPRLVISIISRCFCYAERSLTRDGKVRFPHQICICQWRWIIFTRFSKCTASQEWAAGGLNLHIQVHSKTCLGIFLSIFSGFSWSVLIQLFLAPFHQEESRNYITT